MYIGKNVFSVGSLTLPKAEIIQEPIRVRQQCEKQKCACRAPLEVNISLVAAVNATRKRKVHTKLTYFVQQSLK